MSNGKWKWRETKIMRTTQMEINMNDVTKFGGGMERGCWCCTSEENQNKASNVRWRKIGNGFDSHRSTRKTTAFLPFVSHVRSVAIFRIENMPIGLVITAEMARASIKISTIKQQTCVGFANSCDFLLHISPSVL